MRSRPVVFYACFDHPRRLGGIKQIYRHVELLREAGHPAYVVHEKRKAPLRWFKHGAAVLDRRGFERVFRPRRDVLVLPEDLLHLPRGQRLLARPGRKILFDQNVFHGFRALGDRLWDPYPADQVDAVLCVSEHNRALLSFAYPRAQILRVQLGVDASRFTFRPLRAKQKLILFAVKSADQVKMLFHVIRARRLAGVEALTGFTWAPVSGLTEAETAERLADAAALVFLSTEEGFGLLPVEAMLSGCAVVAPFVGPMQEYLSRALRAPALDAVAYAQLLERVGAAVEGKRDGALQKALDGARRTALSYSLARERKSVLSAWAKLLADA